MKPYRCPRCDGQGVTWKPPWVPGDQLTWASTSTAPYPCSSCGGTGILWEVLDA